MRTVTLQIASREDTKRRFLRAFKGEYQGCFITFETPQLLFKILGGKRWDLLRAMTGAGPMTIREAARRAGRDVKAVYTDIKALLNAGILERTPKGRVVFPYDAIKVNFTIKAAAA